MLHVFFLPEFRQHQHSQSKMPRVIESDHHLLEELKEASIVRTVKFKSWPLPSSVQEILLASCSAMSIVYGCF
jgi:hypothetical protein